LVATKGFSFFLPLAEHLDDKAAAHLDDKAAAGLDKDDMDDRTMDMGGGGERGSCNRCSSLPFSYIHLAVHRPP
jgi:hypothetical protein